MPLNSRSSLDPRWTRHHRKPVVGFMVATIKVTRKDPFGELTYNPVTRQYGGVFDTIYIGKARIQPYGIIGDQIVAQDPTGRRLMRVQLKDLQTGINLDDTIQIIDSPNDPELLGFSLEVRGTIGSSNSWVTDLVCEANLKWSEPLIVVDPNPDGIPYPSSTLYPSNTLYPVAGIPASTVTYPSPDLYPGTNVFPSAGE